MKVYLFVSCVIDQFYPTTAMNVVKILQACDVEVEYNPEQTCCGKFAFNSGFVDEAKSLAEKLLGDFPMIGNNKKNAKDECIVGINASCVGFIKTRYKELFYNTASHLKYKNFVENIYELTDFLVNKVEKNNFNAVFPHKVIYHDSCSSLRELGLKDEGRKLLSMVNGLELIELKHPEVCCGYGNSLFAVQHESISCAMTKQKLDDAIAAGAEYIVTNDMSCLLQLDSYAKKQNLPIKIIHIADVIASQM